MENQSTVSPLAVYQIVSTGGFWSRLAIAKELGRKKTSHVIVQIEHAVSLGYIDKVAHCEGRVKGWLYTTEKKLL